MVSTNRDDPPPTAPRRPVVDELHGVRRVDDYAWLRDHDSTETLAYLAAERAYYDAWSSHVHPLAEAVFADLSARVPPTDCSVSWARGEGVYYTRTRPGKQLTQLCRHRNGAATSAEPEVLLDLESVAGPEGYAALGVCEPSPDGRWLAWSVDLVGDEVFTLRIRDTTSGDDLAEVLPRTYYGCAWSADSQTVFYVVHDEAYRPHQVWRHRLGTPPADDVLVLEEPDERFDVEVANSRSGALVQVSVGSRDTSEVWWIPASRPDERPQLVAGREKGVEYSVEHAPLPDEPDRLLVVTNDGAVEFRLAATRLGATGRTAWSPVLDENPDERLESVHAFGPHLVLALRRDAAPVLRVVDARTAATSFELRADDPAATVALARNDDASATAVTVRFESLVEPPVWWDVDLATGARTVRHRQEVPGYEPGRYVTERLELTARDGTLVPVTLARHRSTPLDGTAPCLLWAYGAYESCDWPAFEPALPSLLDRGLVYALAHPRGGGERGRAWWLDGRLHRKPHTFTDVLDVADRLAAGMVDPDRIVTRGLSAGGLLQGVLFSTAPQRWRAVVAEVPFVDAVTTMLDATAPLTANEWDEWGDPRNPDDFAVLMGYSPYENVPLGPRPALLVTASLHDPRVGVHEPAKWVARLRATGTEGSLLVFRPELGSAAHVGPAGRYDRLRYEAEIQAFVLTAVGASRVRIGQTGP